MPALRASHHKYPHSRANVIPERGNGIIARSLTLEPSTRQWLMKCLRQFVRLRSRGGLLTVFVAYSLAIQAVIASVGLGMSAGASPDGFVLCSFVSH